MVITKAERFWLESDFVWELLKQIPAYVFWKDRHSVYLGCNNAFAYSLGLSSPAEIVGKTDYDLPTTKEESDSFRADDKHVIASKKPKLNIEENQTLPDGRKVNLLTNKVPLLDKHNHVLGILGIYYDITERKQREEELREAKEKAEIASKTKTEFLKNMRHDIRTPLIGITGFAKLIKTKAQDEEMKQYADNLITSSDSLLHLLNSILEAVHVSSGELPLLKKKFNLQEKLHEIILLNQTRAAQKNIALLFAYDPRIPRYLIGDPIRLHRVALELVTNALNFTHKGHVKLSVQFGQEDENGIVVKIIVEDTGIGISPEDQQNLYVQFKRFTPSYAGIYKGYGLGLSLIKELTNDMGGEIYLHSQPGIGTEFTCLVKLKKPLMSDASGAGDTALMGLENTKVKFSSMHNTLQHTGSRILVVEDSRITAHLMTDMLSSMGYAVDVAERGETAVRLAEENHYNLIFMDIGLPGIDGFETTKRIRANESNGKPIPIVALTAHVSSEEEQHCLDVGMHAALSKPLEKEKAKEILNAFISPCSTGT